MKNPMSSIVKGVMVTSVIFPVWTLGAADALAKRYNITGVSKMALLGCSGIVGVTCNPVFLGALVTYCLVVPVSDSEDRGPIG